MTGSVIVLKWGGSLITDKSSLCVARTGIIEGLSSISARLRSAGHDLIIVHGAGGFGHLRARRWRLDEGKRAEMKMDRDGITQEDAVRMVRDDMLSLNRIVVSSLVEHGLDAVPLPPHLHGRGLGLDHTLPEDLRVLLDAGQVPVLYGDVVDCEPPMSFGILSGDDICALLCRELEDVRHLIFAIGGVDGLLSEPDAVDSSSLLSVHTLDSPIETATVSDDVTGGMDLKLRRAGDALLHCARVSLVNGETPQRILDAVRGMEFIGTEILAAYPE